MDDDGSPRTVAQRQRPDVSWPADGTQVMSVGKERSGQIRGLKAEGFSLLQVADQWADSWRPGLVPPLLISQVFHLHTLGAFILLAPVLISVWDWRGCSLCAVA